MKLLNKTTLLFFIPAVVLISLCSYLQYNMVTSGIIERVDKQLIKEKKLIIKQLNDLETTSDLKLYKTLKSEIEIIEGTNNTLSPDTFFSSVTTEIEDQIEVQIPIRTLQFRSIINHHTFVVQIKKPMEEARTFIYGLVGANTLLFGLLVVLIIFINSYTSKKIWKPFYNTLEKLQKFNISDPELIRLTPTNIYEFDLLNTELDLIFKKITRDYKTYKFFIENVSHELQTPIAVVRAKMEQLIQSPHVKEEEHKLLGLMTMNLKKLTKLNQSLILLLKIENNLYNQKDSVNINDIINNALQNFEDIIELKGIKLQLQTSTPLIVECNELLAETLIDNLIKNAVKHNIEGGFLNIITEESKLTIQNSGLPIKTKPEFLFERFRKESTSPDSTGLGLSIVHQICKSSGFHIKYTVLEDVHNMEVDFH